MVVHRPKRSSVCQSAIVWRIRGEVQQPNAYRQLRLGMAAVCKTVGLAAQAPIQNPASSAETASA